MGAHGLLTTSELVKKLLEFRYPYVSADDSELGRAGLPDVVIRKELKEWVVFVVREEQDHRLVVFTATVASGRGRALDQALRAALADAKKRSETGGDDAVA